MCINHILNNVYDQARFPLQIEKNFYALHIKAKRRAFVKARPECEYKNDTSISP